MIKTVEQAVRVQQKRVKAGLKGRSKAVRRFVKREFNTFTDDTAVPNSVRAGLVGNFDGCKRAGE